MFSSDDIGNLIAKAEPNRIAPKSPHLPPSAVNKWTLQPKSGQ
jgi:hypothetical protein